MAVTFPSNDAFVALTRDGEVYTNPAFNENPGSVDMVGTTAFPAIYFATDATHAFFRYRLRVSPLSGGGFDNASWIILFDTDMNLVNSYEWLLSLRGNSNDVALIENLVKNSPNPGWKDTAEGIPISFPITAYDIARAIPADSMLGGVQNYFLDISVDLNVLRSTLGISDSDPLRFNYFTSQNENNFNKDKMCEKDDFDDCFSDFFILSTLFSGNVVNKETGEPVCCAKIELYQNGTSVAAAYTDTSGDFMFEGVEAGNYTIQITKCCYLPLCKSNSVEVKKNYDNVYNFSLEPDCVCSIKCNMTEAENELIAEKERVYTKITDYLISLPFDPDDLWQYTQMLCLLNSGIAKLDCCIAEVLRNLITCLEDNCNG